MIFLKKKRRQKESATSALFCLCVQVLNIEAHTVTLLTAVGFFCMLFPSSCVFGFVEITVEGITVLVLRPLSFLSKLL